MFRLIQKAGSNTPHTHTRTHSSYGRICLCRISFSFAFLRCRRCHRRSDARVIIAHKTLPHCVRTIVQRQTKKCQRSVRLRMMKLLDERRTRAHAKKNAQTWALSQKKNTTKKALARGSAMRTKYARRAGPLSLRRFAYFVLYIGYIFIPIYARQFPSST